MKKKLKHLLWIKLLFVYLLFFSASLLATETTERVELIKAKNDHRDYRYIELKNGITAVLISDPSAQKAAAAIDVGVGSFDNPLGREGIAHFLEHVLFLGNKKYPDTKGFSDFLNQHGGYNNAYTSSKNTNYHFTVNSAYLEEALDRLSQFFISPLFSEKYIQKETNAVHSEHQKNLQSEFLRSYSVIKSLANPRHPFANFSTGNKNTLSKIPNLRKEVISFYQKNYSPNLIKIAVLGKEPLDKLEKMLREKFQPIKKRVHKIRRSSTKAFHTSDVPFSIQIQSLKKIRQLNLLFEIDSTRPYFAQKPVYYISNLLGHEGKGSLFSYLKKKQWVISLSAGHWSELIKTDIFSVRMELTPEGEKNISSIVKTFFNYLHLMEKEAIADWRFDEMKKISDLNFHHQDLPTPLALVQKLSSNQHYYKPKNLINAAWYFDEFQPQTIQKFLKQINPNRLILVYNSPQNIADAKTEKWYKTKYRTRSISTKEISDWKNYEKNPFILPLANDFLPTENPTFYSSEKKRYKQPISKIPTRKGYQVHYVENNQFQVPKVKVFLDLDIPKAYSDPKNAMLAKIFTWLIKDSLNESLYPANLVDYFFQIRATAEGFQLIFEGYPEKIELFVDTILHSITKTSFSKDRFAIAKQKITEERQNLEFAPSYRIALYEFFQLTQKPLWHNQEYLEILEQIDFGEIKSFRKKIFRSMQINLFAFGNLNQELVSQLFQVTKKQISFRQIAEVAPKKILNIAAGEKYFLQKSVKDVNFSIVLAYQHPNRDLATNVRMNLLETIIKDDFYDFIRTNEQLGYIVWSNYSGVLDTNAFMFIVQSPNAKPELLREKIEGFLSSFQKTIQKLSHKEFQKLIQSLKEIYDLKPDNFRATGNFYYSAVQNKDYNLQLKAELKSKLAEVSLEDFKQFYEDLFLNDETTRKFLVQTVRANSQTDKPAPHFTPIENRKKFKEEATFSPIIKEEIFLFP